MKKITIEVPAMYGDHHVLEVRRLLFGMPGVKDVYASSAFKIVEVTFDEEKTIAEDIRGKLEEYGYLEPMMLPQEQSMPVYREGRLDAYFRHTDSMGTSKDMVIGFHQDVEQTRKKVWNIPDFGVINLEKED